MPVSVRKLKSKSKKGNQKDSKDNAGVEISESFENNAAATMEDWDSSRHTESSSQNFSTDTMKSNSSQKSVESPSILSKSSNSTESPSIETAKEAKEKDGKRSWMKNIGSGMRTLRLRKSTDKSSSVANLAPLNNTIGKSKGIKMSIMDDHDEQKSINSKEDDETCDKSGPASPTTSSPTIKDHNSSSAPPNVIPPFENGPTPNPDVNIGNSSTSNKGKASKKQHQKDKDISNSSGTGSLKKERRWRKLGLGTSSKNSDHHGDAGSSTVNGNASTSSTNKTGNGTVPSLLQHQKSTGSNSTDAENTTSTTNKADPSRFIGEGLSFKGKLIGVLEVSGPRGDRICQEALSELKVAVKAAGEHKQKVTIHVALDGLRLRDERTGDCLYHHQVHKISFIAQDLTDNRAFGYIFGSPDTGHRFFGIKTEKSSSQVVMAMRDLFQVVFDLKKKEIERAKQQLEMQQKFLATRAAESAPRTENKGTAKLAETYIDGACALPPASPKPSGPAEADLLNLEVELTNLQEGLQHIHSNLMDSSGQHPRYNRGSTTSISSDPKATCFSAPPYNKMADPFGDSFDPFDGNKFSDPFSNVDPFPLPNPAADDTSLDPFKSPPPATFSFTFPSDNLSQSINTTNLAQSTSNYSKSSESTNGPRKDSVSQGSDKSSLGWTASFEDNFVPEALQTKRNSDVSNGLNSGEVSLDGSGSGINLDIFNDLDPLRTGRIKPFVDKKDFFQNLKNPPKKNLKDLYSTVPELSPTLSSIQSTAMTASQSLKPDGGVIPNSFSTNFNPTVNNGPDKPVDFESHFKLPTIKNELKTSSIRSGLSGADSPPNYSPPAAPSPQVSNSIYFMNPPPSSKLTGTNRSTGNNNNVKKSPQLLKRMTISSSSGISSSTSPRTASRGSGRQFTLDSSSADEIPNLTPPPRPPHSSTLNRNSTIATAVPRPHSAKTELNRQNSLQQQVAPEPPPRPLQASVINALSSDLPLVSPPPLPPKKQAIGQISMSNTLSNGRAFGASGKTSIGGRISESGGSVSSNDLPLPLPCRRSSNSIENTISIPRYAVPPSFDGENIKIGSSSPASIRKQPDTRSIRSLSEKSESSTNLTMEQALSQVATLSLGQLALKLELPVEQLSNLTIQQLAERLTAMNLQAIEETTIKNLPKRMGFETNFQPEFDSDFSTASAPSTMEGAAKRDQAAKSSAPATGNTTSTFDKYAVFRELTMEEASGFSIIGNTIENRKEGSGSGSRTLTSRDSSSERTLQADDEPENPMSTMDDVTDVNFSDGEEKSILDDEIVDTYFDSNKQLPEWATFDTNFEDQCIPLQTGFSKSEESPSWESDENEAGSNPPYPFPSTEARPKLKTTKIDAQLSQFDFQPFTKESSRYAEVAEEGESHLDPLVQPNFQRQSSGSSKHSDKYSDRGSNLSGSTTGRERSGSGRRLEPPPDSREVVRKRESRDSRPSSYSSSGRKYSRGSDDQEDEFRHHRRHRHEYDDRRRRHYEDDNEGGVENPSFDPTLHPSPTSKGKVPSRIRRDDFEDDDNDNEENDIEEDKSYASRHSTNYSPGSSRRHYHHHRKRHPPKYYSHSQSLHRRGRDDRYESSRRHDYSPERYSQHESDFDSYEDEISSASASRRVARERPYHRDPDYSSRPSSSGSSKKHLSHHGYRGNSRDYYYREHGGRHERRQHYYKERRHRESPYEPEDLERDVSDYSGEDTGSSYRRGRGRRPPPSSSHSHQHYSHHKERRYRDRDSDRPHYYYNTNSPSWDSESSPPPSEHAGSHAPGGRRHSADKLGVACGIGGGGALGRPNSTSICDPSAKSPGYKMSRGSYQSELMLHTTNSSNRASGKDFADFETFSSQPPQQEQYTRQKSLRTPKDDSTSRNLSGAIAGQGKGFEDNFLLSLDNTETDPKQEDVENDVQSPKEVQQQPPTPSVSTVPTSNTSNEESDVFFPLSFDADKESSSSTVPAITALAGEYESIKSPSESEQEQQPELEQEEIVTTPAEPKMLAMISEESHISTNSNSNVNTYNNTTNNDIITTSNGKDSKDSANAMPNINDGVSVLGKMKKSDSFNIFERERDPFADDDFFQ